MKTTFSIIAFLLACTATMAQEGTAAQVAAAGGTIKLRTTDSTKTKPLFIIFANRVEVERMRQTDTLALKTLDPKDIESITVLKNANATQKYGWEATAGVVEIYLKDGKYPEGYKKPATTIKKD